MHNSIQMSSASLNDFNGILEKNEMALQKHMDEKGLVLL